MTSIARGPVGRERRTFVEHLQSLAMTRPDDVWLVVADGEGGGAGEKVITYGIFERRVRALAALLQQRFDRGDRALVMLDNDDHYAVSMLACFYAGVIAVPVFPPESSRPQHLGRLVGIAVDARARCVLTSTLLEKDLAGGSGQFGAATFVAVDAVDPALARAWTPHAPADEDVAFLQYTSGSTSAPKGVMVTHGNLMANERAIQDSMGIGPKDKFVSWSPLYHDMGLIGGLLQPLYSGIPLVLTSPRYFLERPSRWLELISRHRATISGGPDFAYRLCLERVKGSQLAQLDLSTWRVAYTGAEPVRSDTMSEFCERFAPAGFDAGAVYPCYGLAEATLFVTGGRRGAGLVARSFSSAGLAQGAGVPGEGATLVGCGAAPAGHQFEIRDPVSLSTVEHGRIGEIWSAGPSTGVGYWGKEQETRETFVEHGGQRWLRTGDLGFLHGGQLFVTGRIKDLIIVRGHNIYPQDIERTIEGEVDAVRKGRVAAFAVTGGTGEGVGVAAEVSRSMQKLVAPQALVDALNAAVSEVFGEPLSVVVLLNPGSLPKTSSGKLQRAACRRGWSERSLDAYAVFEHGRFVVGGLEVRSSEVPRDELEIELAAIWKQALRWDAARPIARDTHFFASGGNSLAATQAAVRIAEHWHIDFPARVLFEQPRLAECAAAVRQRMVDHAGAPRQRTAIPVLSAQRRAGLLPLSHAQQRQWFLWHLDRSSTAYHVCGALQLKGALDLEALQAAVEGLVDRHESLRTIFRFASDSTGAQEILERIRVDMPLVDLCETADELREARMAEELRKINALAFDLTQSPLLRVALIRLAKDLHTLVLVMHHIVSDGTSMQILIDELGVRYSAAVRGETAPWPTLPLQYVDYAAWHAEWLAKGEGQRQLAYWRGQLGEGTQALALPTDHPRQLVTLRRAGHHSFELQPDLLIGLRDIAQRSGATVFMVLLAGLQILLHRHGGQEDVRVGVPVANRQHAQAEHVVGFLVNTLVLRNNVRGRMSLAQVLEQTRQAALDAQAHQDLPFEQLVEALHPERVLGHTPLFQVLFNHLREDYRSLEQLSGLSVTGLPLDSDVAQFELSVEVRERATGPTVVRLSYAADLFDPSTMERLGAHYLRVLGALAAQPETAVGDVPLLAEQERSDLQAPGPGDHLPCEPATVHALFEHQARARPDAAAVVCGDEVLCYAELNARANRLAHRLMALGVKAEAKIGIAVQRSAEMVVGLLAILKAGGAYVPLDPDYPPERLAYMIEDSGIALLLTQGQVRHRMAPDPGLRVVEIDTVDLSAESEQDPEVAVHVDQLAYVIYTSGSTGRPKGAQLCHRNVTRLLDATQPWFRFAAEDVWTMFHSYAFDFSVWEIFGALCTGAKLVIVPFWTSRSPDDFLLLLREQKVTVLNQTPSAFEPLIHAAVRQGGDGLALRHVIFGGEALKPEGLRRWMDRFGDEAPRLVNMYGITETTVHVSFRPITRADLDDGKCSPIGVGIPDLSLRVMDGELNLLPVGVPGELYVGGAGLARGYLNRAGLTAQRFVADPFDRHGGRLYRTGDLVRRRADGQHEYIGRADQQVKIRGFRIELGEIETQLLALPAVRQAAVLAHDGSGGPQLVAYVALQDQDEDDTIRLKEQLARILPEHMVPSVIMVLDALPLNANGKVDRRALPVPAATSHALYAPPQGQVGKALAAIWAEVLGLEQIGVNDNFFDLGGHSLQLIRVQRLVEERIAPGITVVDLFKFPSIGALCKRIEQGNALPGIAELREDQRALRQRAALLQRRPSKERSI